MVSVLALDIVPAVVFLIVAESIVAFVVTDHLPDTAEDPVKLMLFVENVPERGVVPEKIV